MSMDPFTAVRIEGLEGDLEEMEQDRDKWQTRAERLKEILDDVKVQIEEYQELVRKGRL